MLINEMKKYLSYFKLGKRIAKDKFYTNSQIASQYELSKAGSRTEVINKLLERFERETFYLEIGVRNPESNFLKIRATHKFSVDPGYEVEENKADFPYTSDEFFEKLKSSEWKSMPEKFDVIFIDGLHTAEQADRDIKNALDCLTEDGFVVVHDCNPPTEWHAREEYYFSKSPAGMYWNGTTWKAFAKWRTNKDVFSCCVDTDWGVGILSKSFPLGNAIHWNNEFYDYKLFDTHRKEILNLLSVDQFLTIITP